MSDLKAKLMKYKDMTHDILFNKIPSEYNTKSVENTLRDELKSLFYNEDGTLDYYKFQQNKWIGFELIAQMVDEKTPKNVVERMGQFVDSQQFRQGDKPRFKNIKGKNRVKSFVTKVGAGGNYEVARLDSSYVDVNIEARGGGVYCEFERFLDGLADLNELSNILQDAIENAIYTDVAAALIGTFTSLPAANSATHAGFDTAEMDELLVTASAYGNRTNVFCTPEFAHTITPVANFIGDADKADKRNQGYIGRYNGANVIVLPQSFTDESNTTKVLNPEYGFIVPAGEEKAVKLAFEGQSIVQDVRNADMSIEFQVYKKYGIAILHTNQYCIFRNTSL